MENKNLICDRINLIIRDLKIYINVLYSCQDQNANNSILYIIGCKLQELEFLNSLICTGNGRQDESFFETPLRQDVLQPATDERTFTAEELSVYNGRNGNPAYVAVNGVVYDVTSSGAWAAAGHFGLNAGRDLTQELLSCHPGEEGQRIISRLPVVGRMV